MFLYFVRLGSLQHSKGSQDVTRGLFCLSECCHGDSDLVRRSGTHSIDCDPRETRLTSTCERAGSFFFYFHSDYLLKHIGSSN